MNALSELINILKSQTANEDEVYQILVYLYPYTNNIFPLEKGSALEPGKQQSARKESVDNLNPGDSLSCQADSLAWTLALHFIEKIRIKFSQKLGLDRSVQMKAVSKSVEMNFICQYLERACFLIGDKLTEEKLQVQISRLMDMLLQSRLTFHQDVLGNLDALRLQISLVGKDTQQLIHYSILILSCCGIVKESCDIICFLRDAVLERLSIELLTICDSLKQCLSKLSRRKIEKSPVIATVHIAAPMSHCGDMFCMASENITHLAEIIQVFFQIEDNVSESKMLCVLDDCLGSKTKRGVLKHNTLDLPDLVRSSHQSSLTNYVCGVPGWQWSEPVKEILPYVSNSMAISFNDLTRSVLKRLNEEIKETNSFDLETTDSITMSLNIPEMTPKKVIKGIDELIQVTVDWLPLAKLGAQYKNLAKLQFEYLDVINRNMKDVKTFLTSIIEEVPTRFSIDCLPIILSTAMDIVLALQYCGKSMHHEAKLPFHGTVHMFKTLSLHVEQLLVQRQKSVIAMSILQDSASHHWNDLHAFYEGERCSFGVEKWQLYLTDLYHDVTGKLHDRVAVNIVSEIFCNSLEVLVDRYCKCKPSHSRQQQLRLDIPAILKFAFNMMWVIYPIPAILDPNNIDASFSVEAPAKIQSLCDDLLVCLTLVTAPISELSVAVSALRNPQRFSIEENYMWLSFVSPTLFEYDWNGCFETLSDDSAVFCRILHLCHHMDNPLSLTQQLLIMRRCNFAIKLALGRIVLTGVKPCDLQHILFQSLAHDIPAYSHVVTECAKSTMDLNDNRFLNVAYLKQENTDIRFAWQQAVYDLVMPQVLKAVSIIVKFVHVHTWSESGRSILSSLPSSAVIPGVYRKHDHDFVSLCMRATFQALKTSAMSTSVLAREVIRNFEREIIEIDPDIEFPYSSLGAHILSRATHIALLDTKSLCDLCELDLKPCSIATLKRISDLLVDSATLKSELCHDSSTTSSLLLAEVNDFANCSVSLFGHLHSLYSSELLQTFDPWDSFCDHSDMLIDANSEHSTLQICSLICKNVHYISKQLNIDVSSLKGNNTNTQNEDSQGNVPTAGFQLGWGKMLRRCLQASGMENGSYLVKNRPDMQTNAYIADENTRYVETVRSFFHID